MNNQKQCFCIRKDGDCSKCRRQNEFDNYGWVDGYSDKIEEKDNMQKYEAFTQTTDIYDEQIELFLEECGLDKKTWGETQGYQKLQRTIKLLIITIGLMGEAGEIGNKVKKVIRDGEGDLFSQIADEAGDTMWYISRLCNIIGTDVTKVLQNNQEKLIKRKKEGKIKGQGDKR